MKQKPGDAVAPDIYAEGAGTCKCGIEFRYNGPRFTSQRFSCGGCKLTLEVVAVQRPTP